MRTLCWALVPFHTLSPNRMLVYSVEAPCSRHQGLTTVRMAINPAGSIIVIASYRLNVYWSISNIWFHAHSQLHWLAEESNVWKEMAAYHYGKDKV